MLSTPLIDDVIPESVSGRKHSLPILESGQFTPFVALCFTLNYVLGVGALGIPFSFQSAGLILSTAVMVAVALVTYLMLLWTIETLSIAQVFFAIDNEGVLANEAMDGERHILREGFDASSSLIPVHLFEITRKLEVTALCDLILGPWGKLAFQIALFFSLYSTLWAYAAVFESSFQSILSGFESTPLFLVSVFAVVVIPLSCLELTEQIFFQVFLTSFRAFVFFIMFISCSIASSTNPVSDEPIPLAKWDSVSLIFTASSFALLFQPSAPGLIFPLKDQTKASSVFARAIVICVLLYFGLSCAAAIYFRDKLKPSVNLNWRSFSFSKDGKKGLGTLVMNYILVLFPAIDTISVFPLLTVTLGNNLLFALGPFLETRISSALARRVLCRLLACIPPLIASYFIQRLDTILQISGIFSAYIAFVNPSLLIHLAHKRMSKEFGAVQRTKHSALYSHRYLALAAGFAGCVAIVIVIVSLASKKT